MSESPLQFWNSMENKSSKFKTHRIPQRQEEQRNAVSNLFDESVKMNRETSTAKINRG